MRLIFFVFICWHIATASNIDTGDGSLGIAEQNEEFDAHYEIPVQEEDADHSELLERKDTFDGISQVNDNDERLEDQFQEEEDDEFDTRETFPNPERLEDEEEVDGRSNSTEEHEDSIFGTDSEETASTRSIATVMIHHERSSESKIEATVNAFDHTHHLILEKKTELAPQTQMMVVTENGTVEVEGNPSQSSNVTYYEDSVNGAMLYMNADNTLEGMLSEDISLRYEDGKHLAAKIDETVMKQAQDLFKTANEKHKIENENEDDNKNEINDIKVVVGPIPGEFDENFSGNETLSPFDFESANRCSDDEPELSTESADRALLEKNKKNKRREKIWKAQCKSRGKPSFGVEVVSVVDSVLARRLGENVYVRVYATVFWKLVAKRFWTLPGMRVLIVLKQILISPNTRVDNRLLRPYNSRYANQHRGVRKFSRFMAKPIIRRFLKQHDVAHLLTGRDLVAYRYRRFYTCRTGTSVARGWPCMVSRGYAFNAAISEDDGYYTGVRAASRVVAMVLGAGADGRGKNRACRWWWGYIMSSRWHSSNNFRFSACTARAIKQTYCKCYNKCLLRTNYRGRLSQHWYYYPGLYTSLKQQCQRRFNNPRLVPYRPNRFQCIRLHCIARLGCGSTVQYVSKYPALEGTRIGKKFCNRGTLSKWFWKW